ncbi:LacI family DNA-binding transcriptional regulator [Streptomyces sp. DH12]|uniref:LacI family DNA-binding transcriptional regulator n=1 Tax=Streptomyces sp. DH12 TaxID=2857010 RepID=UPI001E60F733|nr:LacI family DNA-binding transcriptional regulator [Streptomyces sp. DH12]
MTPTASPAGPTLAVVAREAGVSVPTASKVVNGREDVAPETRRRVAEVLDRLGYVPRRRVAAPRRYGMVDLALASLEGPGTAAVLRGAERAARAAGLELVVSAGRHLGPDRLDRIASRGTTGVLFHRDAVAAGSAARLVRHRLPYVLLDPVRQPPPDTASVGAADRRGGAAVARHLLALGHVRIAAVAGPGDASGTAAGEGEADAGVGGDRAAERAGGGRLAGWRAALASAGLPHRPEYHRALSPGTPQELGARLRMGELLDLPEPPTAVFVCSDAMAPGVYAALAERGLRVPADVSVLGYGDAPGARWAVPGLTTVRRPEAGMAAAAVGLLVRLAAGERPDGPLELPTELVVRSSTAAPPGP